MVDFEDIYSLYFTDVYKYTLSLCRNESIAEDITQEAFLKALKNINKFKGDCQLRVWICHIAKNTYFSLYKNEKKLDGIHEDIEVEPFEENLLNKEAAFDIHKAVHRLEEPYKEIFLLRFFGELPFSQIGELFNKSESWARVTFHRAKIKLREELR